MHNPGSCTGQNSHSMLKSAGNVSGHQNTKLDRCPSPGSRRFSIRNRRFGKLMRASPSSPKTRRVRFYAKWVVINRVPNLE